MPPSPPAKVSSDEKPAARVFKLPPELEEELRQAVADIDRGDYIELTPEHLQAWAETGELPWPDESHG